MLCAATARRVEGAEAGTDKCAADTIPFADQVGYLAKLADAAATIVSAIPLDPSLVVPALPRACKVPGTELLAPITLEELEEVVMDGANGKAADADRIIMEQLKEAGLDTLRVLVSVFNRATEGELLVGWAKCR